MLVWLLAISCQSSEQNEELDSIYIDVNETQVLRLSEGFELDQVVVLDHSELLLGSIGEIQLHRDLLYVSTESNGNGIYIFDLEGKYVGQFGSKGKGPGEYGYIQSFLIKNDQVYILDRGSQRIDIYDLKGQFLKTLAKGVDGWNLALFDKELVVYAGNNLQNEEAKKLHYYGLDGNYLRAEQEIDVHHADFLNFIPQKVFSSQSKLYLELFSDIIYQSREHGLEEWKQLDFGKYTFPESELDKSYENVADFVQQVRSKNYAAFMSNLRETQNHLSFSYQFKDRLKPRWVVMDKDTEGVSVYGEFIEDALTNGASLTFRQFNLVGSTQDGFIFAVSPNELVASGKEIKSDILETDGNPIVYLIRKTK